MKLYGLLPFATVGTALAGALATAATLSRGEISVGVKAGSFLGAESSVDPETVVHVVVTDPSAGQFVLAALTALPTYLLATTMLALLWRIVGAARRGDPLFSAPTVGRLRALGWLLLAGGPAVTAVEFLARFALSGTVLDGANFAEFDPRVAWIWMLAGFGLLAIGEVVRRGQALRAELDRVI